MHYTIYHNPRCSKSRDALSLLQAQNASIEIIDYLKQPPTLATLQRVLQQLGGDARLLLRTKEELYQQLQLDRPDIDNEQILNAIANHPVLLERPLISDGKRAIIARPTEVLLPWLTSRS